MGKTVVLVVEKMEELDPIVVSRSMGVKPILGVREIMGKADGKWAASGKENAKFGLGTAELLDLAKRLAKAEWPTVFNWYYIGSQVPDIFTVKKAVQEASRYYAKLYKMGFPIRWFDVGGRLGSTTTAPIKSDSSKYSPAEIRQRCGVSRGGSQQQRRRASPRNHQREWTGDRRASRVVG